jgi:hypothetical protein
MSLLDFALGLAVGSSGHPEQPMTCEEKLARLEVTHTPPPPPTFVEALGTFSLGVVVMLLGIACVLRVRRLGWFRL